MVRPGRRLREGGRITLSDDTYCEVRAVHRDGTRTLSFHGPTPILETLQRLGHLPLPPYVTRADAALDRERYQTVYAREPGSVAAPTAGLHFTEDLLRRLREREIEIQEVVLHVGPGTFSRVDATHIEDHRVPPEPYEIPADTAAAFNAARRACRRVIAVGTTTVRTLESAVENGALSPGAGSTDLVIRPGHAFRAVDALLTNFHLPESSLLFLVAAFAGRERILAAYEEAIRHRYRFFSYGDAMFIHGPPPAAD